MENDNSILQSLARVGPQKPVGYLPRYTLCDHAKVDPARVRADAIARGLCVSEFGPDECCIKSGALYVYHPQSLGRLLRENADTLIVCELSTEPAQFVAQIAAVWFDPGHPVYPIIAKAFGEETP